MAEMPPFSAEPPEIPTGDIGRYTEGFALPSYWNGNQIQPDAPRVPVPPADQKSRVRALRVLNDYIVSGRPIPPIPVETYAPGQEFDTGSCPPGTLFWTYEETLAAPAEKLPIVLDEPDPMLHTPTVFTGVQRTGVRNEWLYTGQPIWIATGEGRRGTRRTYAVKMGGYARTPQGLIQIGADEERPTGAVTVGEVQHLTQDSPIGVFAMLRRTVIAYKVNSIPPQPEKKWRWPGGIGGALGWVASGRRRA